jgi:hypothetical protein
MTDSPAASIASVEPGPVQPGRRRHREDARPRAGHGHHQAHDPDLRLGMKIVQS